MPYKFNDARRDKFEKARYRVANPSEYNESLRQRGDLTVWVSDDVARKWSSPRRKTRGGQARYTDLAIEICLTLRVVFRLPLRQTQGFMRSIVKLMGLDLVVPDYSTISRRGKGLKIVQDRRDSDEPITLIVDSTGLKIHGGNSWHEEKHGTRKARKTWRKLHIALDSATGEIVAAEITSEHVGDETALPDLLASVDADVAQFLADGAYDGQGVADCLVDKFGPEIEIIIPPPKNAVHGANAQRNQHVRWHTGQEMKLYTYWRSTTSYRVRIAMNFKGLDYEPVPVNLVSGEQKAPDYAALNPGLGVPTLVLNNGTVLTQSMAILDWLEETHPYPALLPTDAVQRAKVRAAALTIAADIHPVNNLRVIARLKSMGHSQEDAVTWMNDWMTSGFAAFSELIDPDVPFCFGNVPGLADLCLVPQIYNAHRWGCDLTPFARLTEIEARCLALPAFHAARPENQPDAT